MKYVIVTPGGTVRYDVPVMKVQAYSLTDIFDKGLLILLQLVKDIFVIFHHFFLACLVFHALNHGV